MHRDTVIPASERIHRCSNCGRELLRDTFARRENPCCEVCLPERLRAGAAARGAVKWERAGGYFIPTRET